MDELILRTIVIQFDGRVVEAFHPLSGEAIRYHVAQLKPPDIGEVDRKGRSKVTIGQTSFNVGSDEMERLKPLLDKIGAEVLEAGPGAD